MEQSCIWNVPWGYKDLNDCVSFQAEVCEGGWGVTPNMCGASPFLFIVASHFPDLWSRTPDTCPKASPGSGSAHARDRLEVPGYSCPRKQPSTNEQPTLWLPGLWAWLTLRIVLCESPLWSTLLGDKRVNAFCHGENASLLCYQDRVLNKLLDSKSLSKGQLLGKPD